MRQHLDDTFDTKMLVMLKRIHLLGEHSPSPHSCSTSSSWGCSNPPSNWQSRRCNRKEPKW